MHVLTETETRVLGSLIEKDITTPDYYPLSLNALVNACNQKNNRDPVMTLDESTVRDALASLQEKRLAGPVSGADSRVTKFEHRLQEVFNFDRREIAIVCVLLLRGPQTPGELRGRTDRMYHFEALDDIVATLDRLAHRDPPLAAILPRQPGTKESRYTHLFSGEPPAFDAAETANVGRTLNSGPSGNAGTRSSPPPSGTRRSPAATRHLPQAIRITAQASPQGAAEAKRFSPAPAVGGRKAH
jgi:uncharacterized protein YceH (UPF0502 family)